jgi:D-glycero-alpha-D-manno-heptose-7-phosphate kinase
MRNLYSVEVNMKVSSTAPCRVDLAGGTLDIYPLYVFLDGGVTVNMAIDLLSEVRLETREDSHIHLRSVDTGAELFARDLASLRPEGPLSLVARAVRFYWPGVGLNVTTKNAAPHGSGLGASSSLLIALTGALDAVNNTGLRFQQIVDWSANVEAQEIEIPTGKQDYYAALYGGVNAIWFGLKGNEVEPLAEEQTLEELERALVLSFTGESRFSGASNWNMLKAFIEAQGQTRQHMERIKATSLEMREAIKKRDWAWFARLLDEEWRNRKELAAGVTTEQIDGLMEAARGAGALASKICGAGGGGCMITAVPEGAREAVIRALEENGARVLPFRISKEGLRVQREAEP